MMTCVIKQGDSVVAYADTGAGSVFCVWSASHRTGMRFRIVRVAQDARETWRHGIG